jgi:hypothetical protein
MKWWRAAGLAVVVAGAGGAAWWRFGAALSGRAGTAELALRWRGSYAGSVTMPATLNWCPVTHIGLLEGMSGDSGFAVVVYERDALSSGPRSLVAPEVAPTIARPTATAAFRWLRMAPDTAVAGFRADGGVLRLQLTNGTASGDVNAHMRSATSNDTLIVQGTFRGVPIVTTARGCT